MRSPRRTPSGTVWKCLSPNMIYVQRSTFDVRRSTLHALSTLALLLWLAITLTACDYGRMYDQESVRTYEKPMPVVDGRSVPIGGGFEALSRADPRALKNPVSYSSESVAAGREFYGYFCAHCHGRNLDGNGTVGQSFAPLPTDLRSSSVRDRNDGELYVVIRLGYMRHPVLFPILGGDETWSVINYIRSEAAGKREEEVRGSKQKEGS